MDNLKVLFSENAIQNRIKELSEKINNEFKNADELYVLCVLKGASIFFADLVRNLKIPIKFEFIKLSSYGNGQKSSKSFHEVSFVVSDLTDKNVLLVEDIVDSGYTLKCTNEYLTHTYKMKKYRTVALLNKACARSADCSVDADFYGFEVSNEFVVGFGLDDNEHYRELPYIGYFEKA